MQRDMSIEKIEKLKESAGKSFYVQLTSNTNTAPVVKITQEEFEQILAILKKS